MILVDIKVPIMGRTYNFKLDETIPLGMAVKEVQESICQKEQCIPGGDLTQLMLWNEETAERLPPDQSGWECGLKNASRLLLV